MLKMQPGMKISMMTMVERVNGRDAIFRCECGKTVTRQVSNVFNQATKSCGCFYDGGKWREKHGYTKTPEGLRTYRAWQNFKRRNKYSKQIKKKYADFADFLDEVGSRPEDGKLGCDDEICWWTTPQSELVEESLPDHPVEQPHSLGHQIEEPLSHH